MIARDLPYEEMLLSSLRSRLPDKIYDGHFHVRGDRYTSQGITAGTYPTYKTFISETLGEPRLVGGLIMPPPTIDENLVGDNAYNLTLAEGEGFEAGLLVSPRSLREEVEEQLDRHPCIGALKPYMTYLPPEVRYESDILSFAPEWLWALADERALPVILHLSHYQNMLSEPKNYEEIVYLSEKYPRMRMVLAHCAMGHHIGKLRLGLSHIAHLKNIWFDCSGSTEALSIHACLKVFGAERMIFGTDYDHGASLGRICSFGSNFIGFHPYVIDEKQVPPDYRYQPLCNAVEGLVSLFDAGDLLSLTDRDYEKIFYENGKALFTRA